MVIKKKKIGLVFDSSCNLTKAEADKKNIGLVPLKIIVNEKEFDAGYTITSNELMKMMTKETTVRTSTPLGSSFENVFREQLKKFEKVLYIGISKKFSGTVDMAKAIVNSNDEFKNKVIVYDSLWSSPWSNIYMDDILKMSENGDENQIISWLDENLKHNFGFLSPASLLWLYKGGRLTKKQYILGNMLKIRPTVIIENGEIDKDKTIRSLSGKKAVQKMVMNLKEKLETYKNLKVKFFIIKSNDSKLMKILIDHIKLEFKINDNEIEEAEISPEQTVHMGPGAIGLGYKVIF